MSQSHVVARDRKIYAVANLDLMIAMVLWDL